MKILMVLERDFPPDIRVENEAKALTQAGHEVFIACYSFERKNSIEKTRDYTILRKKISKYQYKASIAALKFEYYFNFWRNFINEIANEIEFEAIHIHDLPLARIGLEIKQKYNVKFVLDLHENWPAYLEISNHTNTFFGKLFSSNSQWRKYELELTHEADNIIVVVNESKDRLHKLGIDKNKIEVVSNTINYSELDEIYNNPDPKFHTFYYAGGINEHRGLQYFIRGLALVTKKYSNIRLWLAGEGSYKQTLIDIINELGLINNVTLFGWIPFTKVMELLYKADFALIPHLKSEHTDSTIPHKLFQYMYANKLIISSNCNPIARILNETKTGIVFKDFTENEIAQTIEKAINLKKSYFENNKMDGKYWVKNKYNWIFDSERLIKIYN